jgi:hypothetical protein
MKKILSLTFGVMIAAFAMAQSHATFTDAGTNYDKYAATAYNFTFDNTISAQLINDSAPQFAQYLTVAAVDNGSGHDVTITPTANQEVNRRTIYRYLYTVGIMEINVEGSDITLDDFMVAYINQM